MTAVLDPVLDRPRTALSHALGTLSGELSATARVSALHNVARARIELGDSVAAGAALRTALRLAAAEGLDPAELRLTMAWVHFDTGELDACLDLLSGREDPRAQCLRGLACCAAGDHAGAEPLLSAAAERLTDPRWLANALCTRGIIRSYLSQLAEAETDFVAAQRLYTSIGASERAASCLHNRGFVAFRAGDLPLALRRYDDAERAGLRSTERGETLVDRAGALLAGGLVREAAVVLRRAARLLGDAGRGTTFAEAMLSLARCALHAGSWATARRAAVDAVALFDRQGRAAWAASARAVELRARFARGPAAELVPAALSVAAQCDRDESAELLLAAAEHAGGAERERLLRQVAAEWAGPTAALRAVAWLAKARLATDRRGIYAACRAGLRVVGEQIGLMGSLELQAGAAAWGGALAETGLRAALASGRAGQVLAWTDRYRSLTWRAAPVAPADSSLAADLARLRTGRDRELEQGIRRRELGAPGVSEIPAVPRDLPDRVGSRALLSFVEQDGELWASIVAGGAVRLRRIGTAAAVEREAERLRFATSVALRTGRGAAAAAESAEALDRLVFGPVRGLVRDRPLVIVPCGHVQQVLWAALPSCAGRAVCVVPSATAWVGANAVPVVDGPPLWVAGPGLRHAEREVADLSRRFGGRVLSRGAATVERVLASMDGASMVHVAAHGEFRSDAPLFSNVRVADGPLFGYDLDRLALAPRVLVLSACDVGRSVGALSGAPLGLASVVFRRGGAAVIASTMPVPDAKAADLMTAMHVGIASGFSPAEALAFAQEVYGHLGFVCVGAG